jgi:hypothetical protein
VPCLLPTLDISPVLQTCHRPRSCVPRAAPPHKSATQTTPCPPCYAPRAPTTGAQALLLQASAACCSATAPCGRRRLRAARALVATVPWATGLRWRARLAAERVAVGYPAHLVVASASVARCVSSCHVVPYDRQSCLKARPCARHLLAGHDLIQASHGSNPRFMLSNLNRIAQNLASMHTKRSLASNGHSHQRERIQIR